jgi:site-specific DNA-cytosine methylase
MNDIKHASIIPLIGGFPIAATNIIGKPPEAIFSFTPFEGNDKLYLRYLAKKGIFPPYFQIDKLEEENKIRDLQHLVGKLDIINGTPPCAGLSMSGNLAKGARSTSPVNDWMYKSADFVMGTLRPEVYMFENAPTLYTGIGEYVRNQLMEKARYHGYAGTFYRTDTLLHGIPQRRPRTYVVFVKGKYAPIMEYYHKDSPSVAEYLKSIPEWASMQDVYATKEPFINDFEIVKFSKKKFGENWRQAYLDTKEHLTSYDFLNRNGLIEEYRDYVYSLPDAHPNSKKDIDHVIKKLGMGKNFRLSHRVLCIDKHHIYAVVGEMMERNVHPTEDRRMNIREYMHMMGMPHDFDLTGPKEYSILPQNCPVTTNEDITREAVAIINGERKFSNHRFEMQNNIKYTGIKSKTLF